MYMCCGSQFLTLVQSCHSGSVLGKVVALSRIQQALTLLSSDLPYIYSTEGKIKEPNLAAEAGQGLLSAVTSYARGDMVGYSIAHIIA